MRVGFNIQPFNYVMRDRRKELGLTQLRLADLCGDGINVCDIGRIERLQAPQGTLDKIEVVLIKIAVALNLPYDELFPPEYLEAIKEEKLLPSQRASFVFAREVSLDRMLETNSHTYTMIASQSVVSAQDELDRKLLSEQAQELLNILTDRQREIIEQRFYDGYTLTELAEIHGVTRERIRQIEQGALRQMREVRRAREKALSGDGGG